MTALFRPAIGLVLSITALVLVGAIASGAHAAMSRDHAATTDTAYADVGFLDLKTFLVVPLGDDGEIGLASEQVRVISPETLFARESRMNLLKGLRRTGELEVFGDPVVPASAVGDDDLTIRVNGEPFTLSLGLEESILKDLETNIRNFGDPGMFTGVGFVSAAYLGAMTRDVLHRIEALEALADGTGGPAVARSANGVFVPGPVYVIPAPPALPAFAAGLILIGWLRYRAGRKATRA